MVEDVSYPVIHKQRCKGCGRCIIGCEQQAITFSDDLNIAGYQYAYYKGEGCTGCKNCFFTCPEPLALEVHVFKNISNEKTLDEIKKKRLTHD